VKKLISIGVALALLTMAVVPGAVAAQDPIEPTAYSKIPFAIVGSGMYLVGCLLGDLQPVLDGMGVTLPFNLADLSPVMNKVGEWTAGPLGWSVDMVAWGVGLMGTILNTLGTTLGLPDWIDDLMDSIADGLKECWTPVCGDGPYDPCAGNSTP